MGLRPPLELFKSISLWYLGILLAVNANLLVHSFSLYILASLFLPLQLNSKSGQSLAQVTIPLSKTIYTR
jgi:hypothetical protein